MKETIQSLIANGQTEEALVLLALINEDAAFLLQARYSHGKKQYNMGLVDFGEWQRIEREVQCRLLTISDEL